MAEDRSRKSADDRKESGEPGGGVGRRDEVGGSGVHPASAGNAPDDAVLRGQAEWGQGDRGAAGYEDSGRSEINYTEEELRLIREGKWPLEGRKGEKGGPEGGS